MTHPAITPPRLIAHRGYSAAAPENTLAAVRAAHAAGITWVELDVQLLADGTPVIWHDGDIKRCSNGRGKLAKIDWQYAQQLDVGSWFDARFSDERMASLDAMLSLLRELDMGVNMEIKVNKGHDPLALVETVMPTMLERLPPERLVVSSFDSRALAHCRQFAHADTLALGVLFEGVPRDWKRQCEAVDAFSIHPHWRRLKRAQVDAIHQAGYHVMCYTPNDPGTFHSRWEWGIASAITDEPAAFQRYLENV